MKKAKNIEQEVVADAFDDLIEGSVKTPEKKPKISKRALWIIGGALLIVAVIVISSIVNAKKAASSQTYQTSFLERGNLVAVVGATGTVRANQTTSLYWQTTGRIEKINFAVGELVDQGDQLANLAQSSLPQAVISASGNCFNAQQRSNGLRNQPRPALKLPWRWHRLNELTTARWGIMERSGYTQGTGDQITLTQARLQIAENRC